MVYRIADNILSPLGETTEQNYQAVKAGNSALRRYEHLWGIPEPFTASLFTEAQNEAIAIGGLTRFESLAYSSAKKAIEASAIDVSAANVVFILSTTKGNIEQLFLDASPCGEPQGTVADTLIYPGTAARHIAARLGITTNPVTVCNACISGVSAIILALRLLEAHCYDYAIVCGADTQNKFTVSGFQSLKAISEYDCKPFDMERMGLNLGEAAATMVLTSHFVEDGWAIERGAVRNDAFHISSPSKNGEGAFLALSTVTEGVDTSDLAFVNAHGTATMFNDQMESVAIGRAGLNDVPVNAYKGYFGHTLGAAGILETVLSMAAVDDHTVLATRGFDERGVSGNIRLSSQNSTTDKKSFVKLISGFGGGNAALLVRKNENRIEELKASISNITHRLRLTSTSLMIDGNNVALSETGAPLLIWLYKNYIDNYPKFYKMDGLSRLGLVASELLLKAEALPAESPVESRAVILFNRSSSIVADKLFLSTIARPDNYFPSPSVFVYTLPNIVTGEIAMRNHYHGETSFYIIDERNDQFIWQVIQASFADRQTKSVLGGWIDYQDDSHFEADLFITTK